METPKSGKQKIPDDVLVLLQKLQWIDGGCRILAKLDRPMYEKVNKVLEVAGGKWNKKAKMHLFEDDGEVILRESIVSGYYIDAKQAFQFFETPKQLADQMAIRIDTSLRRRIGTGSTGTAGVSAWAKGRKGVRILEPSAGHGRLVQAMLDYGYAANQLTAMDLNPACLPKLIDLGVTASQQDFLELQPISLPKDKRDFHGITMNPPFSCLNDVKHVQKALDFLAPVSVLAAVMSPAWTFRDTQIVREFKSRLANEQYTYSWSLLEEGTFKESGTGVRTGLLVVERNS